VDPERRTQWQTAWGVVAAIGAAFEAGFVIALITSYVPPTPLIVAGIVLIVSLYFVFAPIMRTWPFRSARDSGEPPQQPEPPEPRRYGVITRETGRTNIPGARFGSGIDVPIDNAGITDAPDAEFGVPSESDDEERDE
jgi:hypothetical protein